MKKIEATVQINKVDVVASAISDSVEGFTILEGNGRGSGKRQIVRSGRGTGTVVSDYNKVSVISTIVKDSDCLLYTSPSPRDAHESRMPSSA